ncbi:MAG: hypothetical protein JW841_14780 [Deltaproteobacteria bacterium]|nr:hypothetical protein [Deltaproteobacteria bacterium]
MVVIYKRTFSFVSLLSLASLQMFFISACDNLNSLKRSLKGEDRCGFELEVQPQNGITIWLDGVQVAIKSPYLANNITPGSHLLEIKAAGYYPFNLPLNLQIGEIIKIPIALRPTSQPLPSSHPHQTTAKPLPDSYKPIKLNCSTSPSAIVKLDGAPAKKCKLRFKHTNGSLHAGDLHLNYRINAPGQLEFSFTNDDAAWMQNKNIIKPGEYFQLQAKSTRITRVAADGATQTLVLKKGK